MDGKTKLSPTERRRYIDQHLNVDWGWHNYEKGPTGYTLKEIQAAMQRKFGVKNVPNNAMSYQRDIIRLREAANTPDERELTEAEQLLDPDRFPEWRAKFFKTPDGEPYQTPRFQHAIFWVMHAATFKKPLPQWVIDELDALDPKHPFPEDINDMITGKQRVFLSFLLLMAPRHGKTELTVHFILHTFALDPNKRIMYGNGTQKKSEGFIDNAIMTMMEGNDTISAEFVKMYGPFQSPDRAWSKMGFTLAGRSHMNKMFSMQPYGLSGNIRSFDSDAIIGDDLADLQRSRSDTTTQGDYEWITTELMLRREYSTSLILVGSHVAVQSGDLFTRLINNLEQLNVGRSRFLVKTIPAHFYEKCDIINDPEHTKCVLWPEGERDYGFLEAQRNQMNDDAMFEAVFNQIPMQPKMMHFPSDVMRAQYVHVGLPEGEKVTPPPSKADNPGVLDLKRSWRDLPIFCCNRETAVGLGFDPAFSEKQGTSYTAISVKAVCTVCGRRYWVDYGKDRMSPEAHPDFIGSFTREYPQIEVVTIEINAAQKYLTVDPRMEQLAGRDKFYIKEWRTDERKGDPDIGIPAYGRHYKSGMVSIPYATIYDQEFAEPLLKEFIRWPQKPNDQVMSGWLCDRGLDEIVEASRYATPEYMLGTEQWRTQWHDENTFEVDLSEMRDDGWEYS